MPLATYGANIVLDTLLGSGTPGTVYIALLRTVPTDPAVTGAQLDEPTDSAYERAGVVNTVANWPAANNGQKRNAEDIIFPVAVEDWGLIRGFAVTNAATGGDVLGWGRFNVGRRYNAGMRPRIAAEMLLVRR